MNFLDFAYAQLLDLAHCVGIVHGMDLLLFVISPWISEDHLTMNKFVLSVGIFVSITILRSAHLVHKQV